MNFIFASHPSVYTLPGTWEAQPEVVGDPTLLAVFGTTVFATIGILYLISSRRKRKRI